MKRILLVVLLLLAFAVPAWAFSLTWLDGYAYYRAVNLTAPSSSAVGEWVLVDLTDSVLVGAVAAGDTIHFRKEDGTFLPSKALSSTSEHVRCVVELPTSTVGLAVTVYACIGSFTAADETLIDLSTGTTLTATSHPDALGPTGEVAYLTDGTGATEGNGRWVHSQVYKVTPGTWLADDGAGGTVTHIMVSTPYLVGGILNSYENPCLLYSTDDGATWLGWPAFIVTGTICPIVSWPGYATSDGDDHYADPCLVVFDNGGTLTVRVFCGKILDTVKTLSYWDVTGTDLTSASVGGEQTATQEGNGPQWSPTILVAPDGVWYCYGFDPSVSTTCSIYRWQSVDDGATWTDKTEALKHGGELDLSWWHGEVNQDRIGGYYYLTWSEYFPSASPGGASELDIRMWRSPDGLTWTPNKALFIKRDGVSPPTWCSARLYVCSVFEKTDGSVAAIVTAINNAAKPAQGLVDLPNLTTGDSITSAVAFGYDRATESETEPADKAIYDFADGPASGLTDVSANAFALSVGNGTPAYVAGTGYTFDRTDSERLTTGAFSTGGTIELDVEVDMTLPSPLSGANSLIVSEDNGPANRTWVMYISAANKLTVYAWGPTTYTTAVSQAGDVVAGERHVWRVIVQPYGVNHRIQLYKDGRYRASGGLVNIGGSMLATANSTLNIGAYKDNSFPFSGTIHAIRIRTTIPRLVDRVVDADQASCQTWAAASNALVLAGTATWDRDVTLAGITLTFLPATRISLTGGSTWNGAGAGSVTHAGGAEIDCWGTGRVTALDASAAAQGFIVRRAVDASGNPVRSWNGDSCTNVRFLGRRIIGAPGVN